MGERISRDLIRTGEKTARVVGVFCDLPQLSWFDEMGIYPDENGELLISRQIAEDGKNVCRVSSTPCTVAQLKELGRQLINIHGQHDSQRLLDERVHLSYLDSFAALGETFEAFSTAFGEYQAVEKKMEALRMDEAEKSRRIDTLKYQIDELSSANLQEHELEELTQRRDILRNSSTLTEAVEGAYYALSGDDDQMGAVALLSQAERMLSSVASVTSEMEEVFNQVSELYYSVDDIAERVRDMKAQFEFSPYELDEVESRLDLLYRLGKKYGKSTKDMLAYHSRIQNELESIEMADETLEKLELESKRLYENALLKAKELSQKRQDAAVCLQEKIEEELRQLDMPNVRFHTNITEKETMDQLGFDHVQFYVSQYW